MRLHRLHFFQGTLVLASLFLGLLAPAQAIVRYGTPDRQYLAATGEYASIPYGIMGIANYENSGGPIKGNPAWPISPNWALRANHVASNLTGYDIYQGDTFHTVTQAVQVSGTDLTLVRVDKPFSSYFHMYDGNDEIGKEIVMFGASNPSKLTEIHSEPREGVPSRFNGWTLGGERPAGENDLVSWGRNQVTSIETVGNTSTLYATFDAPTLSDGSRNPFSVGDDEAIAYSGDSGGAYFLQQNGEWRLGAIIYAVDPVYLTQTSEAVLGAVFDARDLWGEFLIDPSNPSLGTERRLITDSDPVPVGTYASRISQYRDSIDNLTAGETRGLGSAVVPEASTAILVLVATAGLPLMAGRIGRSKL